MEFSFKLLVIRHPNLIGKEVFSLILEILFRYHTEMMHVVTSSFYFNAIGAGGRPSIIPRRKPRESFYLMSPRVVVSLLQFQQMVFQERKNVWCYILEMSSIRASLRKQSPNSLFETIIYIYNN